MIIFPIRLGFGNGSSTSSPPMAVLKSSAISLTVFLTLFFFLSFQNYPYPFPQIPKRSLLLTSNASTGARCSHTPQEGLINYFCVFPDYPSFSLFVLSCLLLLQFYILIRTAQDKFSVVVTKLSSHLNLSPSMAAVTLLALGNGAPDVFASVAAVRSGHARTGFGAILSAGAFVSAFVVGVVSIYSAPFSVDAGSFIRDVMFYLVSALFLFSVYLSGEIFLWQAVGFAGFYFFFVGIVFWMDFGTVGSRKGGSNGEVEPAEDCENGSGGGMGNVAGGKEESLIRRGYQKISRLWEVPIMILLNLTIPQTEPAEWNRFYQSGSIVFFPLALLYSSSSFMPLDHPIVFLLSDIHFPLWLVVLFASSSLAVLHFILEKEPPKTEQLPVVLVAFVMSVFWISTVAGELLNNLAAIGVLLELPSAILGLTVLAWGNSVGDLVADVAVAKAGQPTMAIAGCFACPMFNMLFGLGTGLVIQTANVYPEAYKFEFHIGIVVAFVFLLLSLMGSLLVVTWCRFRMPRFWGFFLVGLYILFMAVSLLVARFAG